MSHTDRKLRSSKVKCSRGGGQRGCKGAKGSGNAAVAAVSKQERQTAMRAKINAGELQRQRDREEGREGGRKRRAYQKQKVKKFFIEEKE